jgi:hypothetical protein
LVARSWPSHRGGSVPAAWPSLWSFTFACLTICHTFFKLVLVCFFGTYAVFHFILPGTYVC